MVNELPIQYRLNNLITCGLWINKNKPKMDVFLNPFVIAMNRLSTDGIISKICLDERVIKVYVLICCVDSVARAPVQGIKLFNGKYGCSWCEHPGVWAFGSMRYPIMEQIPRPREHESMVNYMLQVEPGETILGILYPSPFINLLKFNIVYGFVPDYMHCVLEGVGKQLTNHHLSTMTEIEIKNSDEILKHIKYPCQVSRLARPLSVRNDWSAREWENFILFSSVPLFSIKLSKKLLDHWMIFVESIYILLNDNITGIELDRADEMLHKFVSQMEPFFGIRMMTSNVHQLLHLSKSVLDWGPLWAHSTFPFESENRNLLRAIRCARGATQQIVRFVNLNHSMITLREFVYPKMDDFVKFYCDYTVTSRVQNALKLTNITYFGEGENVNGDEEFLEMLQLSPIHTKIYNKAVKEGCLYGTHLQENKRSDNSFALLNDGKFVRLQNFIVDHTTMSEFTICHDIVVNNFTNKFKILK